MVKNYLSTRLCKECNSVLPPNATRNYCDSTCYKRHYRKLKSIKTCDYCKKVLGKFKKKFCSKNHRMRYEQIIRARKKVRFLIKKMGSVRRGYRKEQKAAWRVRNRTKLRQYWKIYYQKNKAKRQEAQKKYYYKNQKIIIKKNQERRLNQKKERFIYHLNPTLFIVK